MLEVYRDDQIPGTTKSIALYLQELFSRSSRHQKARTAKNFISNPISNADFDGIHDVIRSTQPFQSRDNHVSAVTLVSPEYQNQRGGIATMSKCQELNIQDLADQDHQKDVTWDQKAGPDPDITIICPSPWTPVDPYDFHVQELPDKDHEIALRLQNFTRNHNDHFAEFKILKIPTTTGKSDLRMAGWARSGFSLNFVLSLADTLEILSLPLQRFILSKTSTALELYDRYHFPVPQSSQVLCNCFQIWREEPLSFSLKFGMSYLDLEGSTAANQRHAQAFMRFLTEIFKKSAGPEGTSVNSADEFGDHAMMVMERKRVDSDLSRIFAQKDCIIPQEKLNTTAERRRP